MLGSLIEFKEEKKKPTWKAYQNALDVQNDKESGTMNHAWLVEKLFQIKKYEMTSLDEEKHAMRCAKKEKPISSCTSELESVFNPDLNSDNDNNKNNSFSSVQNNNDVNSDSNSNSNSKQYIALPDLTKEQKLKWFSNNNKGIMPECIHDTDTEFDLKYSGKDPLKLEAHSHICIDLKIALEISATIIVQLAFRSSLAKKRINIREGIIDTEYVRNIIAMLQNDLEKAYIIDPNEKIAQAIFLPLVKIVQLVSVGNKEELGITAKGIQGFRSTDRIDIPVNMVEKKIVDKGEIISTCCYRNPEILDERNPGILEPCISSSGNPEISGIL
ncbi:hypothetical protein G9A89_022233 [Geosiphon pyriformis]|nr:hypothetical protein G9A89_022233 [Geosiphon pyriformis]